MKYVIRLLAIAALLAMGLISACTIDSADEFYRDLPVNFSGFYAGNNGGNLVEKNSGSAIKTLDLRQTGDSLEAVDNNGRLWRGNIGDVLEGSSSLKASFSMEGTTSSGAEGTFSGTLSTEASSSTDTNGNTTTTTTGEGKMEGTYVESAFFSTFYGEAQDIAGTPKPPEVGDLSISPSLATLNSNGVEQTFTASGGGSNYSFKVANTSRGQLINQDGAKATYRRTGSGDNSVTVSSGGKSATATIRQPGSSASNVTISPQIVTLTNDAATAEFTASGGNGTFSFSVGNSGRGSITGQDGSKATYKRISAGDNTIKASSGGASSTATILQP